MTMANTVLPIDRAEAFRASGWCFPLAMPRDRKFPPPSGYTGETGGIATPEDIARWRAQGLTNLAGRLTRAVIGIDKDFYKAGTREAFARREAELGALPATWSITSRDDGSGIFLFRVPPAEKWEGEVCANVEVIQYGHRYAMLPPSVHPEGRRYRMVRPDGTDAGDEVPKIGDLPKLPDAWVEALMKEPLEGGPRKKSREGSGGRETAQRSSSRQVERREAMKWLKTLRRGTPCARVGEAAADALAGARREDGSAYDHTRDTVLALLRLGEQGHVGVRGVLRRVEDTYVATVADTRPETVARGEFKRFTMGGVAKVLADPSPEARRRCECRGDEDSPAAFERDVRRKHRELRVLDEARRREAAEKRAKVEPPEILTLADRLARPRVPVQYRIDGWQPAGSRVVLTAQRKAGKTTLVGNLVRSLVDGKRFLGVAECQPIEGTIAILDFEMGEYMLDRWLEDQQIKNQDRVVVIPMRGRASTFDLRDPLVIEEWAERFRQWRVAYLVLDCLRPLMDALGLDENREAGTILTAFDTLLERADIGDAMVVTHMGHTGERSRGDSRVRDWPEVEWKLVREDPDDDNSARYISAYGRDVDQGETKLHYDHPTRHLTLAEGSRKDSAALAALDSIELVLMEADEPMSARAIERALADTGHSRDAIRRALKVAPAIGRLSAEPGPNRSTLYQCASARVFADSAPAHASGCAGAPIEGAPRTHDPDGAVRGDLLTLREAVRDLAERCGWPEVEYVPGHRTVVGADAWAKFIDRSEADRLHAVQEALLS